METITKITPQEIREAKQKMPARSRSLRIYIYATMTHSEQVQANRTDPNSFIMFGKYKQLEWDKPPGKGYYFTPNPKNELL